MNDNIITFKLCDEDRSRLDYIIDLLAQLVDSGATKKKDDITEMAENVLKRATASAEPAKNAQEAPKASDHPTLDPFPELPTAKAEASEAEKKEEAPTVSTAELQQLVIALCRNGKKDKVREVVSLYGVQTVAAIPEDKRTEAYGKLKALEG